MIVNAGIVVDLGNSETRMLLITEGQTYLTLLSTKYAELPRMYRVSPEYRNDKSVIFCTKGCYFANGQIVDREFVGVELRPSAVQLKVLQLVTDLTFNLVFIKAINHLAELLKVRVQDLDVTFDVSVLLPPLEHEIYSASMEEKIKSFDSVRVLVPADYTVYFKVGDVNVYPEGVTAFFSAYYSETAQGLVEVEENKKYGKGYVLVVDIGAGTTDVVIIKDTELVLNSKDSFKRGGNTVESIVRNEIKKKYGFSPKNLDSVIQRGILVEGDVEHDVTNILNMAKDIYSKALTEDIQQYLERLMLDMPEISGLLIIGGGSLPALRGDKIVSPAMSDVLMKYFKTLAPNINTLSLSGKSPRLMNIEGLKYIHKYA